MRRAAENTTGKKKVCKRMLYFSSHFSTPTHPLCIDVQVPLPARPVILPTIRRLSSHILLQSDTGLTPYLMEFDPLHIHEHSSALNSQTIPTTDNDDHLRDSLGYFRVPDDSIIFGRNIRGTLSPKEDIVIARRRGAASIKRLYDDQVSNIRQLRPLIIGTRDERDSDVDNAIPILRYGRGNDQGACAFNIGQSVQMGVGTLQLSANMRDLPVDHPDLALLQHLKDFNNVCSSLFV